MKLGLASNFQDEVVNVKPIWDIFKDVVDLWTVVDSGSTDGTIEELKAVVGDKLNLIQSDMIKEKGYGYARTKLIELSKDMDWVLIIDGDERMWKSDAERIRTIINKCDSEPQKEIMMIELPRCHFREWDESVVEYGSMDRLGNSWREALKIHQDWQPRLLKRVMVDGKSKLQFFRRVHEILNDVIKTRKEINDPVIRHFGWIKSDERKKLIANLCQDLWLKDQEDKKAWESYEKEREAGSANVTNPEYLRLEKK